MARVLLDANSKDATLNFGPSSIHHPHPELGPTITMPAIEDWVILPMCAFFGHVGLGLTGFGMAIIFWFVWQVAVLSGYESDFKYAVFIQALALLSAQPLLIYRSDMLRYADSRTLVYFLPIMVLTTPLGQLTGERIPTTAVESVGGILVTIMAVIEIYQKRTCVREWCARVRQKKSAETTAGLPPGSYPTLEVDFTTTSVAPIESAIEVKKVIKGTPETVQEPTCDSSDDEPLEDIRGSWAQLFSPSSQLVCSRSELVDSSMDEIADNTSISELAFPSVDEDPIGQEAMQWTTSAAVDLEGGTNNSSLEGDTKIRDTLSLWAKSYTIIVGAASGFLGGLCGIRGPPVILYFLYPPVYFGKHQQRATAVCMSASNAAMRVLYYLFDVLVLKRTNYFVRSDWGLYLVIAICSLWGCYVGSELFGLLSGSHDTIRSVLAVLLLLCGVSLMTSGFG